MLTSCIAFVVDINYPEYQLKIMTKLPVKIVSEFKR